VLLLTVLRRSHVMTLLGSPRDVSIVGVFHCSPLKVTREVWGISVCPFPFHPGAQVFFGYFFGIFLVFFWYFFGIFLVILAQIYVFCMVLVIFWYFRNCLSDLPGRSRCWSCHLRSCHPGGRGIFRVISARFPARSSGRSRYFPCNLRSLSPRYFR
jgi:hypothetical protein